jgi:DNA-binding NarL/FixJ family response regulator
MGNESGIDLLKKIRSNDSKTRIIITSAFTDLEDIHSTKATELAQKKLDTFKQLMSIVGRR